MKTIIYIGAVVLKDCRVLLVRQAAGHPLEGQWTIPWGTLDCGESPAAAVVREISEEGGISAEIEGLLGVQELPPPWDGHLGILYLCRHVSGKPEPDYRETDAAQYFSYPDLESFDGLVDPLSSWLSRRVLRGEHTLTETTPTNPFAPSVGYL